eukprot:scaffold241952_cov14-Tisochrysis_lutea.AAC.1
MGKCVVCRIVLNMRLPVGRNPASEMYQAQASVSIRGDESHFWSQMVATRDAWEGTPGPPFVAIQVLYFL